MHLVIADDSAEMRWLVRRILAPRFADITEAADGRELLWCVLQHVRERPRDGLVIVADVCMPVYDGLDVLDACGELDYHVTPIVITSFPSLAVRARVAEIGGVLVPKPFAMGELRRAVESVCAPLSP
jgi:DNA-binding NtrC family response regulator